MTTAPTATEVICPLDQVTLGDADAAGMKAAILGELGRAGLPVPQGFVILAPAYGVFAREAALDSRIAVMLADRDLDDRDSFHESTLRVRQVIESEPLPAGLAEAIVRAYESLAARPVAVRASGPDFGVSQPLGGIFDSFLGVDDPPGLLAAVKRCWSSRFSADHLLPRSDGRTPVDLAVLVQVQVPATRAGIAFTVDPATGNEDRIVIEAGFGLSAGIVSGGVSADRYVLDKKNLVVLDHSARSARRRIERVDGMTAVRGADAAEPGEQVMTDSELRRLAALVTAVEQRWSDAQEIEWACDDNGSLWIVQARALPRPEALHPAGAKPLLHGLGAARGRATGRVRFAGVDPSGITLAPGEVFVAHVTSPDSIPPLHLAAAIVTDGGGMASHAAVAARWLGIPCVVGTAEATNTLEEGQMITVDGDRGLILEAMLSD